MLTSDFDYQLPDEAIAQEPRPRGTSRLFCIDHQGPLRHTTVDRLREVLSRGDLLVINNTRVIPARLYANRDDTGGQIELLLAEKVDDRRWTVLAKPGRKAKPGAEFVLDTVRIVVEKRTQDGRVVVEFSEPIEPHLHRLGRVPLPPYIRRPDRAEDRERYQTVYASADGAIAAPTAGLHFTRDLLEGLQEAGVGVAETTLHVGIGTFKPVVSRLVHEHAMEPEWCAVPPETVQAIEATRARGGSIVAVGTTVVRTLESAVRKGHGELSAGEHQAELFITPGFEFRVVDALITNFHLPKSTLLMLVSAFAGRTKILDAYAEALEEGYRFYSYGDAMFLKRK